MRTLPSFIPSRRPAPRQAGGTGSSPASSSHHTQPAITDRDPARRAPVARVDHGRRAPDRPGDRRDRRPGGGARPRRARHCGQAASGPTIRLGASRAEADASPQDGQRGPQARAFDRRPERLRGLGRQLDDIHLDPAAAQPAMDQFEEPLRQVPFQLAAAFELQRRTQGAVQLQHAVRVVHPPRGLDAGRGVPRPPRRRAASSRSLSAGTAGSSGNRSLESVEQLVGLVRGGRRRPPRRSRPGHAPVPDRADRPARPAIGRRSIASASSFEGDDRPAGQVDEDLRGRSRGPLGAGGDLPPRPTRQTTPEAQPARPRGQRDRRGLERRPGSTRPGWPARWRPSRSPGTLPRETQGHQRPSPG